MSKKVEELEKRMSKLETMIMENRKNIVELLNICLSMQGKEEIDTEKIKTLDTLWLNEK